MATDRLQRSRSELSAFLTRSRARVSPAQAGLPAGQRRRTPGLRREEVAALAGVGLTWYTWLEQGRDIRVSEAFLLRVASALKLDDAECSHLFLLAHSRPPPPESHRPATIGPLIQQLLDDLSTRPGYVLNPRWDVVAWNPVADTAFGFRHACAGQRNLLRMLFTDPQLQARVPTWPTDAPGLVKQFRFDSAFASGDPLMPALVDDLTARSAQFRRCWKEDAEVRPRHGIASIRIGKAEPVPLRHETLLVDEHLRLRLVVYFATPVDARFPE